MWNNISSLNGLSSAIQWISIVMIFLGGLLQIGKLFVDNKIKTLKSSENIQKEIKINQQVDSLKTNLFDSKKELIELRKKTKYVDPYAQPIETGKATVRIKIKTKEKFNSNYMDRGGYLAFGKGNEEMLAMSDNKCTGKSINNEEAIFQGVFELNASHKNIGENLTFLKEAEYIQIQFLPLKKNYEIIEGKAICIFNGNARIEFDIPKQTMDKNFILIRNLTKVFNEKFK
jgi:hypothetical protein